jgi:DNA-binding LacI/PurR family transcriptional regulator
VQLRYLAKRGHRHLAVALPDDDPPLGPVRLRFARDAAAMIGLPPPESFAVPGDRAAAAGAVRAFRAAHPGVTALAAFDDDVALRILAALRDLELGAPRDLAVIGFDYTDYGFLFTPALTTVHIDAEDHGRRAARVILGLERPPLCLCRQDQIQDQIIVCISWPFPAIKCTRSRETPRAGPGGSAGSCSWR